MTQDMEFLRLISWIKRGRQRKLVLFSFPETKPIFPEELRKLINIDIKEGTKLSLREISRQLSDFKSKELVICLDEELPWGRSYILTKKGIELKSSLISP